MTELVTDVEDSKIYWSMFERSHVAQVVLDPDFRILDVNDAFCTIVAYPRERLLKMDFRDFKGKKMLKYLFDEGQTIADAERLRKPVTAHVAWVASNGTHIVDRHVIPFYDDKGDLKKWYIIYNEVTALEEQIEEARLYQTLFEQNHVAQVILDNDLNILHSNEEFCTLVGMDMEKVLSLNFKDFREKDLIQYLSDTGGSLSDALEQKKLVIGESTFISASGKHSVLRYNIPFLDKFGSVKNLFIIYNEVTELENQLEEVKLYHSMFEKSQVAQVVLDPDFTILDVNDAFCTIVAYPRERLLNMDFRDFKGKKMLEYLFDEGQTIADAERLRKPVNAHAAWVASNGTHIVDRNVIPFYDDKGDLKKWYIIYNEVTDLENRLEETKLYHSMFEKSQVAQVVLDPDFTILDVNDAFCTIVAYPRERLLNMDFRDFKGKKMLEYLFDEGQTIADAERLRKPVNAHAAWVASNGTHIVDRHVIPFYDDKENLKKWYIIYNEVTEISTLLEKIKFSEEKLSKSAQEVSESLSAVAKGDLTKVPQTYPDDPLVGIKNDVRTCMDNISALAEDTRRLVNGAIEGELATRADPSKHLGEYRRIIEGVNATLDAVIAPVKEAMRISEEYAACNFTARFSEQVPVQGDFACCREALNKIGVNVSMALSAITREIDDLSKNADMAQVGVNDVSMGAQLIAQNAENVSINAEKSQAGIDMVMKTMEDMNKTIMDVSQNTENVARLSGEANLLSKKGTEFAEKADKGMKSITRTSTEVDAIFKDIKGQMDQIGKIIGLIGDIANQTNLLALNAAIEAARAGEAGRGFAVVASEVKALAGESRNSAENIEEMISGLQKQTETAASVMTSAGIAVQEGNLALADTLRIFSEMTKAVDEVSRRIENVAGATEEQASSFEEITANVVAMSNMVTNTAKDAMNSSATSEEALAVVNQITEIIKNINNVVDNVTNEMRVFKIG